MLKIHSGESISSIFDPELANAALPNPLNSIGPRTIDYPEPTQAAFPPPNSTLEVCEAIIGYHHTLPERLYSDGACLSLRATWPTLDWEGIA